MTPFHTASDIEFANAVSATVAELKRRAMLKPSYIKLATQIAKQAQRTAADRLAEAELGMTSGWKTAAILAEIK